jgi:peptidoglycan/LPS O-acetylase OafA/YrhL
MLPGFRYKGWTNALLLGLTIPMFAAMTNKKVSTMSAKVAKYSYGIYLSHFFVLWITFQKLGSLPFAAKLMLYGLFTGALSYVLYHLVEEPMIRRGKIAAQNYLELRAAARLRTTEAN